MRLILGDVFWEAGVLKRILESTQFVTFIGNGWGSYLALALVLEWTPDSLINWIVRYHDRHRKSLEWSLFRLFWTGSLVSNSGRLDFLSQMILQSPFYRKHFLGRNPEKITFSDLDNAGAKTFISSTHLKDYYKTILLSKWTSPDLPVLTAVAASMSMIPIFEPVILPGYLLPLANGWTPSGLRCIDLGYSPSSLFDPISEVYYKNLYPDLKIDPEETWDLTVRPNKEKLELVPIGPWSFWALLHFLVQLPKWTRNLWRFPELETIKNLYTKGYQMASDQKINGLKDSQEYKTGV